MFNKVSIDPGTAVIISKVSFIQNQMSQFLISQGSESWPQIHRTRYTNNLALYDNLLVCALRFVKISKRI